MTRLILATAAVLLTASGTLQERGGAQGRSSGSCAPDTTVPKQARWPAYLRRGGVSNAVVFVHAPGSNGIQAWLSDAGTYWPSLVAKDRRLTGYDVFVHEFYAPGRSSVTDMNALVRELRGTMESNQVFEQHRSVAFVVEAGAVYMVRSYLLRYPKLSEQVPFVFVLGTPTLAGDVSDGIDTVAAEAFVKSQAAQWQTLRPAPRFHCTVKVAGAAERTVAREAETDFCSTMPLVVDATLRTSLSPGCFDDPVHVALQRPLVTADLGSTGVSGDGAAPVAGGRGRFGSEASSVSGQSSKQTWVGKPVAGASRSINVGCNQAAEGTLLVQLPIDPERQEIVSAVAKLDGVSNLKQGEASVRGIERQGVVVSYRLVGLDQVLLQCAGGGHGHVAVIATVRDKQ